MSQRTRAKTKVLITRNFEENLDRIERFLGSVDGADLFDRLLEELLARVIPLLERTPRLGPPFITSSLSEEARFVLERIHARLDGREVRQLVRGDFTILYLVSLRAVALVAVRHHREQGYRLAPRR